MVPAGSRPAHWSSRDAAATFGAAFDGLGQQTADDGDVPGLDLTRLRQTWLAVNSSAVLAI
jgi:hypothetical protein